MAFDDTLAERIRAVLRRRLHIQEKRMFGGLGFLLNGNMLVGVWKNLLIARIGPEQAEAALKEEHVRPMDITGKPMKGWVMVEPDGVADAASVESWVRRAIEFVDPMPAK